MTGQPWARLVLVFILFSVVSSAALLLPKCCPLAHSFVLTVSGLNCSYRDDDPSLWNIPVYSYETISVRQDVPYNYSWKPLPCTGPGERTLHNDKFHVLTDGSIDRIHERYGLTKRYCLEFFVDYNGTYPFFCVTEQEEEPFEKYFLIGLGYFLSVPFALATLLIYLFIRELHTLHGSIVIRHMLCFIVASVIIGLTSTRAILSYNEFDLICASAGTILYIFAFGI